MNNNWDLLMNEIRTREKITYQLEHTDWGIVLFREKEKGVWVGTKMFDVEPCVGRAPCQHYTTITYRENFIIRSMAKWGHKEKKEYLKMNKIKGYGKCTNHRQLNKLMMSF